MEDQERLLKARRIVKKLVNKTKGVHNGEVFKRRIKTIGDKSLDAFRYFVEGIRVDVFNYYKSGVKVGESFEFANGSYTYRDIFGFDSEMAFKGV